jgi:hypothetical protein
MEEEEEEEDDGSGEEAEDEAAAEEREEGKMVAALAGLDSSAADCGRSVLASLETGDDIRGEVSCGVGADEADTAEGARDGRAAISGGERGAGTGAAAVTGSAEDNACAGAGAGTGAGAGAGNWSDCDTGAGGANEKMGEGLATVPVGGARFGENSRRSGCAVLCDADDGDAKERDDCDAS